LKKELLESPDWKCSAGNMGSNLLNCTFCEAGALVALFSLKGQLLMKINGKNICCFKQELCPFRRFKS